jgi:uncharacterized membrane protein YedE/YeeE
MSSFTPWSALAGGVLIGTSAVLLLWLNGRIAGVSGIAGGVWSAPAGERSWRWLFLGGLVLGGALWALAVAPGPAARPGFPAGLLVLAGLLVGYGTSMAGGCTSGHGVCGLARRSPRSLVATAVFLVTAMLVAYVTRHLLHIAA